MSQPRMHENELAIDGRLVRNLVARQFPAWASLPLAPVPSAGTDNALFRLGDELVVRLPRIDWAVGDIQKERIWLPELAPHLPLEIPEPIALGEATSEYPWPWAVYRWIPGVNRSLGQLADPHQAASDLAGFIASLQQIPVPEGARPTSSRGGPLAARDGETRAALACCQDLVDVEAAAVAWERALRAPGWAEAPVWLHGDLQAGNLLFRDGRLRSVIDFGCLGIGDPAVDVMAAWLYLDPDTRRPFRRVLDVDAATWERARGWALSVGLIAFPYYRESNSILAGIAQRTIEAALSDPAA